MDQPIDLEIQKENNNLHHQQHHTNDNGTYSKQKQILMPNINVHNFSDNQGMPQNMINISKIETFMGITSQKDCQVTQNQKQLKQSSNQEKQQKEQNENSGNVNNNSLEQSTGINTFRSSQNVYIQNYDTAGICEQNFCYCFTHTVDIVTLFLAFIVGRTAHRKIFFWRILISLCFDLIFPAVFANFYNSLRWEFIASQMGLSFIFLVSSMFALAQETPQLARFSLALNVPFVSLFKIIIRCSNNLFCREDQVNTANYLSHRPIISLYLAHIAKSAILSSSLISYITVLILTLHNMSSLHNSKLGVYMLFIMLYSLDLLRNAYQAIVAENNHRLKANVYLDTYFKRQFSNELPQDISIQNYDNQNKYKGEINQLLDNQLNTKVERVVDENAKTNKISSLQVCLEQRQQGFLAMKPMNVSQSYNIDNQTTNMDQKKIKSSDYKGFSQFKQDEQKSTFVFYDKSKEIVSNGEDEQILQSIDINIREENNQKQREKSTSQLSQLMNEQQQQKEEQIRNQMNQLLKETLNDDKFKFNNENEQTEKHTFVTSNNDVKSNSKCIQIPLPPTSECFQNKLKPLSVKSSVQVQNQNSKEDPSQVPMISEPSQVYNIVKDNNKFNKQHSLEIDMFTKSFDQH